MRTKTLVLAITAAMAATSPLMAQEKTPENGIMPSGPSTDAPQGLVTLEGQSCVDSGGTNCPDTIADLGSVSSTQDIGECGTVNNVRVGLDIAHQWVGDLEITLTAPDSTSVVVFDRPGVPDSTFGCAGDDILAMLDDEAVAPVENECAGATPTIHGTFIPNNPLSTFDGVAADGTWTLDVVDMAGGQSGTLNDWTLDVSCGEAVSRATFAVNKVFTDGNPGDVEVTLSCNTGLPLEQSKVISEGDGVKFVVTDYDDGELDCEVTETPLAGYDAEYNSSGVISDVSCSYEDLNFGSSRFCQITNSPAPVDVVITKEWLLNGPNAGDVDMDYTLTLYCDAEIVGGTNLFEISAGESADFIGPIGCGVGPKDAPSGIGPILLADWCKTIDGNGADVFTEQVIPEYPSSNCWVSEVVYDDAVEFDTSDCDGLQVSAGVGDSCTVVNTVFFEGIPTLSEYGRIMLILLTLGVGFVGLRRFV